MLAEHQEGVVPKIVAKLKTGGQTFQIRRNLPRPTAAQALAMQACFDKLRSQNGGSGGSNNGNGGGGFGNGGGGFGGGGGGGGFDRGAFSKCLPKSLRQFRTNFTTPTQTLQQVLESAADEHHDDRVHDRRRRPDRSDHGSRHQVAGHEGPLPRRRRRP